MVDAVLYGGPQDGLRLAVVYPAPPEIVFAREAEFSFTAENPPDVVTLQYEYYRLRPYTRYPARYDYAGCR